MICLGIFDDTKAFTLEVPASRLEDLRAELQLLQRSSFFTKKQLQSLLVKLSFVTECVKPGRIFMDRLLTSLRECKHAASHRYPISTTILLDIQWWLEFLPHYHHISLIKPSLWDFESLNFSTNTCLQGGGATCQTECISFAFPNCISMYSLSTSMHWNFSRSLSQIHRCMRQLFCRYGHQVQYLERSFYATLSTTTVVHGRCLQFRSVRTTCSWKTQPVQTT